MSQTTTARTSRLVKVKSPRRNAADTWIAISGAGTLDDIPLPYGPEVPDALADGTIPKSAYTGPLLVTAERWPESVDDDMMQLFIDGVQVGPAQEVGPPPGPSQLFLPLADLQALSDGAHELHFETRGEFTDNYVSQAKTIIIDTTPPGGALLPRIEFRTEYEQNGVTIEDLEGQAAPDVGILVGTIPTYFDQDLGQHIHTFLQVMPGGPIIPGDDGPVVTPNLPNFTRWTIAALIAAQAAGDVEFFYTVTDRAGNSKESPRSPLRMLVFGAPDQLIAPRIPLHADDDLINEGDARTPITVEIPEFANAVIGDVITLNFGSALPQSLSALTAIDIPADPANPDPDNTIRSVELPYSFLWSLQPDNGSGGVDPVFSVDVSYEVKRGIFPALHSDVLTPVNINLTIPGGPDPAPETPENENLLPPVLTHDVATDPPNIIPVGYTPPVVATISHLAVDNEEVFAAGDTVQLFRYDSDGTTEIAIGTATAATPGADLVITLADTDVVAGSWRFFYRIARTLSPGGQINEALSPTQAVLIADAGDQPGGPDLLPNAIARDAEDINGRRALRYSRARDGAIIRIYDYLNFKPGDKIDLTWQGNNALNGGGTDIPTALLELTHTVEEEDTHPKDDRLLTDNPYPPNPVPRVFVDFIIPYDEIQKISTPPSNAKARGSAWITYTVTAESGASNTSETDRTKYPVLVIDAREPSQP